MPHYSEAAFEVAIEKYLLDSGGFKKRKPEDFDSTVCLDPEVFISFVKETQAKEWAYLEKLHKTNTPKILVDDLCKALGSDPIGSLSIIRHGFKCYGKLIYSAYFAPASGMNPDALKLYESNNLTITRQVHYSTKYEKSVDVVLFLNGIPIITIELKNPMTGQTWQNAVHQYRHDRDQNDLLFSFKKRALVHFAVDTDEAYMTTRLLGESTEFLPFNKGNNNGAGNPENPSGYKPAYLWEEVLSRESLLDIIARFLHLQVTEKKIGDKIIKKETMIFPRYHQLDCVRKLIDTSRKEGPGKDYLVQHSAGSGKSNTIAWIAHRLSSLHDDKDNKVFDSVVVITDRLVLDQQLQNTIYQFEHKAGVVIKIDENSTQLAQALKAGSPIIITTLQKFPFVTEKVGSLPKKKYAVIVDEAHSSQGGEGAAEMKGVLGAKKSAEEDDEKEDHKPDAQDIINESMAKRGKQPNLSFFAFTATPKYKTLEVFGRRAVDGKPEPFHLYSMRQAIEEGFILDVLEHYTTYKTYYRLTKSIADDPKVDKKKAAAALARYVSFHPHNLAQKTEVIIEHFRTFIKHKIGGQAKAMVVSASRLHAVRYKQAIDEYIKARGYDGIHTLVAFSGTVRDKDTGIDFTEVGMNKGIKERELPEKFNTPEYCVLIVAEKYQTGFDQPLLHTMYVDKKLGGIQAIQTLSRLNRTCPGKDDTFVLDFRNEPEEIQAAFQPYYEKTIVGEEVDYQKLYELQTKLAAHQIYFETEVEEFCRFFFAPRLRQTVSDHAKMNSVLDLAVKRFILKTEDEKEDFRSLLISFKNLYAFLSQILPFQDSDLEKLYTYLRFLHTKFPKREQSKIFDIEGDVALKYYRLQKISEGSIKLQRGKEGSVDGPSEVGTAKDDKTEVELSKIIEVLNEKFKTDFTPADELFIDSVREDAVRDQQVRDAAVANTIDNFQYIFDKRVDGLFVDRMEQNENITSKFLNDPEFKKVITSFLIKQVYERVRKEMGVVA